jgi:hypothetical protein
MAELTREAVDRAPEVKPADVGAQPRMILTKLGDLLNEPEDVIEWLVDGLLPESGFSLLVAKPKVGKSTLARNLALCVAQGKDFLGRKIQQGVVVYLALEEKRAEVRKHFRDMGAMGDEEIYTYAASAPADGLQQVRAAADRLKPALIIIDPLFRLTRVKDSNDYAQVTQALEPLLVLARETRAHVLCAHHAGKGNRDGGDSILGSTAIFAAVDTALIMKKMEGYRTLQSEQRYGDSLEETVLCFDATTRTITLGATREAEDTDRLSQAICEYLQGQTDPVTEAMIDDAVEGRTRLKRAALRHLVAISKVTRYGKGGKADPFKYSLPAMPQETDSPPDEDPTPPDDSLSQDSCSDVPITILGTREQESQTSLFISNGAGDSCSQVLPIVEKSWEQENGLGNQHPDTQESDAQKPHNPQNGHDEGGFELFEDFEIGKLAVAQEMGAVVSHSPMGTNAVQASTVAVDLPVPACANCGRDERWLDAYGIHRCAHCYPENDEY